MEPRAGPPLSQQLRKRSCQSTEEPTRMVGFSHSTMLDGSKNERHTELSDTRVFSARMMVDLMKPTFIIGN